MIDTVPPAPDDSLLTLSGFWLWSFACFILGLLCSASFGRVLWWLAGWAFQ